MPRRNRRSRHDVAYYKPRGERPGVCEATKHRAEQWQGDYDTLPPELRHWLATFRMGVPLADVHYALQRCGGDIPAAIALLEDLHAEQNPFVVPGTTPQP